MSLYSALYSGVSGLGAQSSAMATVADNITNINTVGYKGVTAEFRTLVTDGRLRSSYSAGGVAAAPQAMISKQGLLQASSGQTDLGIDGAGFFVTRSGSGANDDLAYTRAGAFKPDLQGYLVNPSGYYLQGWRLDATGQPSNNLEAVRVSELTGSAASTSRIQMRANLRSDEVAVTTYDAGAMADGTVKPHFSRPMDIYDAQGTAHQVTMSYIKTGPNTWAAEMYAVPPADAKLADPPPTNHLLATGRVAFQGNGSLDDIVWTGENDTVVADDAIQLSGVFPWAPGDESEFEQITLALGTPGQLDGLTQFADESAIISSSVDGGLLGTIASVEISPEGKVSAIFSDGTARAVFQLPIATFQNPDGLSRISGNAYMASGASGSVAINAAGTLGGGKISAGTLEASNVDLAQEFTNMIRFQRAYSASSKVITTVDDMLQELGNLKR